tara:strand:- start:237 stop:518 length:282 start_codon:yes stop_codon:yes gene_type:complete
MKIEIKEITLDSTIMYTASSYPYCGIFLVTDNLGGEFVVFVGANGIVMYIGTPYEIKKIALPEGPSVEKEGVSESFVLDLVSVIANKQNPREL